jgi:hypothetical protein
MSLFEALFEKNSLLAQERALELFAMDHKTVIRDLLSFYLQYIHIYDLALIDKFHQFWTECSASFETYQKMHVVRTVEMIRGVMHQDTYLRKDLATLVRRMLAAPHISVLTLFREWNLTYPIIFQGEQAIEKKIDETPVSESLMHMVKFINENHVEALNLIDQTWKQMLVATRDRDPEKVLEHGSKLCALFQNALQQIHVRTSIDGDQATLWQQIKWRRDLSSVWNMTEQYQLSTTISFRHMIPAADSPLLEYWLFYVCLFSNIACCHAAARGHALSK